MRLAERYREDRRLGILALLEAARPIGLRVGLLADALADTGRAASGDALRTDLAWLAEQGLATVDACEDGDVARATERGVDVALGRARSPGVRVPD